MASPVEDLLARMRVLRDELDAELQRKRGEFEYFVEGHRVRFARDVELRQQLYRVGLLRYLRGSRVLVLITAPVIYSGFAVFALMDLFVTVYQGLCFPVYGIAKVSRSQHMAFDRGDLPYLNAIERFNCFYCSYANGVASYLREVAARTEQYWCPIKHTRRVLGMHDHYPAFFEFGDGEAYRAGLERMRRDQAPYSESPAAALALAPATQPATPPDSPAPAPIEPE